MAIQNKIYIGLDLGTSSVKGVLTDGVNIAAKSSKPFCYETAVFTDGSAYTALDADKFYDVICGVIKELVHAAQGEIAGISTVSASGNTLLLDKENKPLIKAYSWTNPPMEKEVQEVLGAIDVNELADICGWQFYNTFPIAHLSHLRCHAPDLLDSADYVCTLSEYVTARLTGKRITDISTATPSYLLKQKESMWNGEMLSRLGIEIKKLPDIKNSGFCSGSLSEKAQCETGLSEDCLLYLGSFDHPGAAKASGIKEEGQLLISCGTSWVCFFPHHSRELIMSEKLLCDPFLTEYKLWGGMFSLSQIGKAIDGLVDEFIDRGKDKFMILESLAEKAQSNANGLKINPLSPAKNDIKLYTKENIARAIMEGAATELKSALLRLEKRGVKFSSAVMAGGPSKSKLWVEIISEILGIPVEVKYGEYSGAVGAAMFCRK